MIFTVDETGDFMRLFIFMTQFDFVRLKSGFEPNQCACNSCQSMCKNTPCIGTPDDIMNIIEAGYGDRVEKTLWVAGVKNGPPPTEMIQPSFDQQRGCCTFLTESGLCELHELGLKPTEGRLATCDRSKIVTVENHPAFIIAKMWDGVLTTKPTP
jgi:hypothetical protein